MRIFIYNLMDMHPSCVNDVMLKLALGSARAYMEE
jgi:hypothetical protein